MPTSNPLVRPPKRLFIIGPMNAEKEDENGLTLDRHIPNIEAAANAAIDRIRERSGDGVPEVAVITPPNETGRIPNRIFGHIMHCDLAIADISEPSPNVFYELAMLHSMGAPVILIARPETRIFYLLHENAVTVSDFDTETLLAALDPVADGGAPGQLETTLLHPSEAHRDNPITDHFKGVHFVNVAATSGLATGQFYNFLQFVIMRGGIFKRRSEGRRYQGLILVRPTAVQSVDDDIADLEEVYGTPVSDKDGPVYHDDGRQKHQLASEMYLDDSHPRDKYFIRYIKDWLIDYPTPISSLVISQQYANIAEYFQKTMTPLARADIASQLERFEQTLIDIYFDTIEKLATETPGAIHWNKVKIMTVPEIIAFLGPPDPVEPAESEG